MKREWIESASGWLIAGRDCEDQVVKIFAGCPFSPFKECRRWSLLPGQVGNEGTQQPRHVRLMEAGKHQVAAREQDEAPLQRRHLEVLATKKKGKMDCQVAVADVMSCH